jgi:peptidoglycan/LPS O-acetylase OafA/YrhL
MVHNVFMASYNTMGNLAMSVTWSIGVEEQFYIVFPFIVYLIKEKWLPALLLTVIVAACFIRMQYHTWYPTYVLLPSRMDSIAFGVLVAYYNRNIDLTAFVKKYFIYFNLVLVLVVAVCAFLYLRFDDLFAVKHSLFALFFSVGLVFALTLKDSLYAKLLRNKLLVWIGTLSYSLYLFHCFILGILHYIVGNNKLIVLANGRDIMITIAALIISVLFAWGVYKVFETPMVKLGKRYKY